MRVTAILADAAQVGAAEGKLHVLGAGWNMTGPRAGPHAVALIIEVPWTQANERHKLTLELQDPDGQPVRLGPEGIQPRVEAEFEVGRPAGHPYGEPLNVPMAYNFQPLPLEPGGRYVWVVTLNGATNPDWKIGFNVRPAAAPQSG